MRRAYLEHYGMNQVSYSTERSSDYEGRVLDWGIRESILVNRLIY